MLSFSISTGSKRVSFTCPHIWFISLNGLRCPSSFLQLAIVAYVSLFCWMGSPSRSLQTVSVYVLSHRPHLAEQLVLPFFISTVCRRCLRALISNSFCWMACTLLFDLYRKWEPFKYVSSHRPHFDEQLVLPFSISTGSERVVTSASSFWVACTALLYLYRVSFTLSYIRLILLNGLHSPS